MRLGPLRSALLALGLILPGLNAPPAQALESPVCSWAGENSQSEVNIGAPDSNEYDWLSPLKPTSEAKVVISGKYPAARYFSFHLYNETGEPMDSIYDQQIAPDAGSVNPFRAKRRRGAGDSYHVTIVFAPKPADPAPNTIYTGEPSERQLALLVYRVYVPTDAESPTGGAPYPQLTTETTDGVPILEEGACATTPPSEPLVPAVWQAFAEGSWPDGLPTSPPSGASSPPQWSRAFGSRLGNQQNAYLVTDVSDAYGQIVVFHTRAPTFPDTTAGVPVYKSRQLRYWSFCTYDSEGEALVGCVPDYQSAVRKHEITFVVSNPASRPANATAANGVMWLPWGDQPAAQIVYRNMLPAASFPYAAEAITSSTQSVAETMGPYYPSAVYCSTATFERGGWRACARASS